MREVQKTGEATRDRWHKTDWAKVAKDPTSVGFHREDWIHKHDAERHANEVFDEVFKRVSQAPSADGAPLPSAPAPAPLAA